MTSGWLSSVHLVSFLGRDEYVDTLHFGGSCVTSIFSAANENATCAANIQEGDALSNLIPLMHTDNPGQTPRLTRKMREIRSNFIEKYGTILSPQSYY